MAVSENAEKQMFWEYYHKSVVYQIACIFNRIWTVFSHIC